jgi:hypothetical protein
MGPTDLIECVPDSKHDVAAVKRAELLGYPGINAILPDLLIWIKDMNWPVAWQVVPLLAKAGPEIAPSVKAVLNSDDDIWKHNILFHLAPQFEQNVRNLIKAEVSRIADSPNLNETAEEADAAARDLLAHWEYSGQ